MDEAAEGEFGDEVPEPYSQSLLAALLRAREAVMTKYRPMLRRYGVTEQQWRVLRTLTSTGPLAAAELANLAFLTPPSLSRLLGDLEDRQLIQTNRAGKDLRRRLISISPGGAALIGSATPELLEATRQVKEALGERKLRQLQSALDVLQKKLG